HVFKSTYEFSSERPLRPPLPNTMKLLNELDRETHYFGYVPLSLKLFYKVVGACNFAWDCDSIAEIRWRFADPIQIDSLDEIVAEVSGDDWKEYLKEIIEEYPDQLPYIEIAADYYHKDNVSGGPAYAIQLTNELSVDSLFLNEQNETTFIDYLRICMENCGFSRITNPLYKNDYQQFFDRVKPRLKMI
ncbi:MAG: hypothetical protein ACXVAZ_14535, partial [Mucilaginibacter sp.]